MVEVYNKSNLQITAGNSGFGDVAQYAIAVYTENYTSKLKIDENGYVIYDDTILICYTGSETELLLPDGITEIYDWAFFNRDDISSVTIPETVTKIDEYAFWECSNLTSVVFKTTSGWKLGNSDEEISGLDNAITAAQYLTNAYYYHTWVRG